MLNSESYTDNRKDASLSALPVLHIPTLGEECRSWPVLSVGTSYPAQYSYIETLKAYVPRDPCSTIPNPNKDISQEILNTS